MCRHAYVPNSHSLPAHLRKREKERMRITRHLVGARHRERTKDARAPMFLCNTYIRPRGLTRALFCRAFSSSPRPFKTARAMNRRIKCSFSFFVRDTRASDLDIPLGLRPKCGPINRPTFGMLIRNLDRSLGEGESFGAIASHSYFAAREVITNA